MVVAPHPDDETLGCGGLIQRAVAAGAAVRIVFLTNGDGFRFAVEREYRKLQTTPDDYMRFGELRRREAVAAARLLGLRQRDLTFLGFPDGSLMDLWRTNWSVEEALMTRHTRTDRVPYAFAQTPGAPHCGQSLVDALRTTISSFGPTDLYVTHPSDDHEDHAATSAFATLALTRVQEAGGLPSAGCRLHYYIVHRGNWPQPQGQDLTARAAPPVELMGLDTRWQGLKLTAEETARKARAIRAHRSQLELSERFLMSFARRTEVFGMLRPKWLTRRQPPHTSGHSSWVSMAQLIPEPTGDNLVRRFRPQADITALDVARTGGFLELRVRTSRPPTVTTEARIHLRFHGDPHHAQGDAAIHAVLRGERVIGPKDVRAKRTAEGFTFAVPVERRFGAEAVTIETETAAAKMVVDRAGPRLVLLRDRE